MKSIIYAWRLRSTFAVAALTFALVAGQVPECAAAPQAPVHVAIALSGTNVNVSFDTGTGHTYWVERSDTLAYGSWSAVGGNLAGSSTGQVVTDVGGAMAQKRFYRVACQETAGLVPTGFALIPAGSFSMGNALSATENGNTDELPVHSVTVSAFFMEKMLVSKAQWDGVYTWAIAHGYTFDNVGLGKASNHPVQTVSWYDCVKWCNARSEQEGLAASYTVGGVTYKAGQSDAVVCNMGSGGYRLPTEAEWEKAARGGLSGKRFPWGDTIDRSRANYRVSTSGTTNTYSYDLGSPGGFDPTYAVGVYPYTSPVGAFAPNGYGLYDMAGNVFEWCWDWFENYRSGAVIDPEGAVSGSRRVLRGGRWSVNAYFCRVARRDYDTPPRGYESYGFRCVRR